MYYILSQKALGSFDDLAVIESCPRVSGIRTWFLGRLFNKTVPKPLVFEMSDVYKGIMPDFFDETIPLFSKKLVKALNNCGVDNFIKYKAELVDQEGNLMSSDYYAINIIGVQSVTDFEKSEQPEGAVPSLVTNSFDSLSIDENKTHGQKMFRLAESVGTILVDQSVKTCLESINDIYIGFIKPEDWMSI